MDHVLINEHNAHTGSAVRDIPSPRLGSLLTIIDAFPSGMLGYLIAQGKAEQQGKLDEFYQKIEAMIDATASKVGTGEEPVRPSVEIAQRLKSVDTISDHDRLAHRVFAGTYPMGIVYGDRAVEVAGDYKRLAFLCFSTLELEFYDCPDDLVNIIRDDAARFLAKRRESN